MRAIIRKLELPNLDANHWHRRVINTNFNCINGQQVEYQGDALVSESDRTHTIEFEFQTHPLSPVSVQIPLSVSVTSSVRLRTNDQLVGWFELSGSKAQPYVLHCVSADVTEQTLPNKGSRFELSVSHAEENGTMTILLGDDLGEQKARVVQEWTWLYALPSIGFFTLAWGSMLGLAILSVVNIRAFGDKFRFYAVATTVGAWILTVLGISDLAKVPLRALMRQFYAWTNHYRAVSLMALTLLFVLIGIGTSRAIYGMTVRQRYARLIYKAMEQGPDQDEEIRRAFVLLPWRREAQYLFERRAWGLREDMNGFRHYIRSFVSEADVRQAATSASSYSDLPFYLDKSSDSAFSDPVVWYSSILPEADDEGQDAMKQMALSVLSTRTGDSDAEAKIMRTCLRLAIVQRDEEKSKESALELGGLLSQFTNYERVATTQTYQVACDLLACYYVAHCQSDAASEWFRKELETRDRQRTVGDLPLWHRPPEKLMLYHMFLAEVNATDTNEVRAIRLLRYRGESGECEPYESKFEEAIFNKNPGFHDKEAWLKGTVLDGRLNAVIQNTLLDRGWRY